MSNSKNKSAILFATVTGSFLTPYGASSINIALPAISGELNLNAVLISWVATLYLLSVSIFLVPFGRLADIYGRKRIFFWGIVIITVASIFKAFSPTVLFLLIMQIIHGIGSAMVFATSIAIVISIYPPSQRGKMLGINVASTYLGLSLGPVIGGFLTQYYGWRSVFFSNVPVGILIIILVILKIKTDWTEAKGESFDFAGSLMYAISVLFVILGLSRLPHISGFFFSSIGIATMVLFFMFETTVNSPVLQTSMFKKNITFTFSNLAALINYSATHAVVFMLSLYLQYIKGLEPRKAGLVLFVQPLVMSVFSPVTGRLSDRLEPGKIASIGMAINAIGLFMLTYIDTDTSITSIVLILLVLGTGFALFSSPNTSAAMGSVDKKYYGTASATIGTMRTLGQMFSMGISTLIFTIHIGNMSIIPDNHISFLSGLHTAFMLFSGLCVIGILFSFTRGTVLNSCIKT